VFIKEIKAKSILRKYKKIDSWFLIKYGMNLYRGCAHNCVYCDGRAEKYQVNGEFGRDITVKINAIEILRKELNRNKIPQKPGFIGVGGGVGDSYQLLEKKYELTRKTLHLLHEYDLPVHILTKSTLVARDLDIIKKIHDKHHSIVSFSFSSTNDDISRIFEPGVPTPTERLETIKMFKKAGISCGMYLMPVIPCITDNAHILDQTIKNGKDAGIDFIVFGGMTLKDGRQKKYFYKILEKSNPQLIRTYNDIYKKNEWGNANSKYYAYLNSKIYTIAKKYKIPNRIPPTIYKELCTEKDLVIIILEHIDYLLKLRGEKSPYGYAAYLISKLTKELSDIGENLRKIRGVGATTEKIIKEILSTGSSMYYEQLLFGTM
jgi:DNA repair photolyase